jgi:methyltransferase
MITRFIFIGIVAAVIVQRLFEMRISQFNAGQILAQGGQKQSDNFLGTVKILQVSWWISMLAEVWYFNRPFIPVLAAVALAATMAGQILRYLSMQALQWRWTLPIMTLPDLPVIDTGIYRYLRHPNWLGVTLEITFLPLIHSAYLTAIIFSIANILLTIKRVQAEEQALMQATNYALVFADTPRFIPKI